MRCLTCSPRTPRCLRRTPCRPYPSHRPVKEHKTSHRASSPATVQVLHPQSPAKVIKAHAQDEIQRCKHVLQELEDKVADQKKNLRQNRISRDDYEKAKVTILELQADPDVATCLSRFHSSEVQKLETTLQFYLRKARCRTERANRSAA